MDKLEKLKILALERGELYDPEVCQTAESLELPRMYSDEELLKILGETKGDVYRAAYEILIQKSESTKATIGGLTLPETSGYYLRLASRCRKNFTRDAARADEVWSVKND